MDRAPVASRPTNLLGETKANPEVTTKPSWGRCLHFLFIYFILNFYYLFIYLFMFISKKYLFIYLFINVLAKLLWCEGNQLASPVCSHYSGVLFPPAVAGSAAGAAPVCGASPNLPRAVV